MSTHKPKGTALFWKVSIIDTNTRKQSTRTLKLDTRELSPLIAAEIHRICGSTSPHNREIIGFRSLFSEVHQANSPLCNLNDFISGFKLFTIPDYFEDQYGNSLSLCDYIKAKTGKSHVIILGNPQSIFEQGSCDIVNAEKWDIKRSNKVAHFLDIVQGLEQSKVYEERPTLHLGSV